MLRLALVGLTVLAAGCGDGNRDEGRGAAGRSGDSTGGAASRGGLSLLLISIDTCRPDHLGCYGYEEIETPRIDDLAAAGTRFARALATAPITLPSHASLLTAEYPYHHRVRNNATYRLPEGALTLAEWVKREGYVTAAFVGSYPMESRFGLDQGFDLYDDRLPYLQGIDPHLAEIRAEEVADRAVAWLEENGTGAPFFLFVHFFDPHWRYDPPEPFASLYKERPYDGEIAYVDGEVGRLTDALDRLGLAERTVVVLTGDHGEGLGAHGEETHAIFLYDTTIRIPLIIRPPARGPLSSAGWRPGGVVESLAREVDIAPTVLDLLGLPPLPDAEGRSLAPLLVDPEVSLELVHYAETFAPREDYGWSEARSIVTDRWKYILLPREELYDLVADPGEERNLIDRETKTADRLRALLEERIRCDREWAGGEARLEISEEERARLEAPGYMTRTDEERAADRVEERPDPKDRIDILREYFTAVDLLEEGKPEAALRKLEQLSETDPGNPDVRKSIGDSFALMGQWERADSVYRTILPLRPHDLFLLGSRGNALLRLGRIDEAVEVFRELLSRDSEYPEGHVRLGECRLLQDDPDAAEREFREELRVHPDSPSAYSALGTVQRLRGEREEAIRSFRRAIELRPDFAPAYQNLGNLYEETEEWEKVIAYYKKAIEADPDLVEAYYNLALAAKRHGRRDAAWELLHDSVTRNPRFAKGYFGLGNLLREDGRPAQAIVQYEIALRYDPKDSDVYLNLGAAHADLGMVDEAVRAWEAAVDAAPRSPSAQTARKNIESARTQMGGMR